MINFIIISIFLALGFAARNLRLVTDKTSHSLNLFVIYICLPSVVLLRIPFIELNTDLLLPALMPWLMVSIVAGAVILAAYLFRFSKNTVGAMLLVCCFGNTSFFGFPMVTAFWGEETLVYAIVYDVLGSFLSLAVLANIIVALYADNEGSTDSKPTVLSVLKRIILFPPFIAVVVSLSIQGVHYPEFLKVTLDSIALLLVPTTMFIVGMHFSFNVDDEIKTPLKVVLFIKLIVTPCLVAMIVYGVWPHLTYINYSQSLVDEVTVFEAAMPPMVTTGIMAMHAKLAPKLAAAAVGLGLLSSVVSLSLVSVFLQ